MCAWPRSAFLVHGKTFRVNEGGRSEFYMAAASDDLSHMVTVSAR